jgi:hypothetical protein
MRFATRTFAVVALCGLHLSSAIADDKVVTKFDAKITPSGPLKAYKGPEGELVAMVEINDGKEILVHFKNFGGDLEGKTVRQLHEDLGNGNKNVYVEWKRGSKTYRKVLLTARDNRWELYPPGTPNKHLEIRYSEAASEKLKIDDVIKAIKP